MDDETTVITVLSNGVEVIDLSFKCLICGQRLFLKWYQLEITCAECEARYRLEVASSGQHEANST